MTSTVFDFTNRHGLNITGLVEHPAQSAGLIFIMHGFKGFKEQLHIEATAAAALENNLTTVRFDATNSFGDSGGDISAASFTSYIEDLTDVINWAKNQSWYQAPFILAGSSMGGIAVLEYTNAHPADVKALAPMQTCISGKLSLVNHQTENAEALKRWQDTGERREISQSRPGKSGRVPYSHMEDRLKYDAMSYANKITAPAFLLVGSEDTAWPPSQQEGLYKALGSETKEFHVIEGAPHTFRKDHELDALKGLFSAWLKHIA